MAVVFSEAFMRKYGGIVNAELEKRWMNNVIFYYLDWRNWKFVQLNLWLKDQIKNPSDKMLDLIQTMGWQTMPPDKAIISILQYCHDNIRYVSDKDRFGVDEVWMYAEHTLDIKQGDCEDGAVLIYVLAELSGIPTYQLRLSVGTVKYFGYEYKHCYVLYKPENSADIEDVNWKIIDWTWFYDNREIKSRPYIYEDKMYYPPDWTVNSRRGYGKYKLR